MNRILSWKIDTGVYAYIYLPNTSSHISTRLSEDSPLWTDILSVVGGWSESEYKSNFTDMANEIRQRFGVSLAYQDEFYNFSDSNTTGNTNVVLIAGKDGTSGSNGGGSGSGGSGGDPSDVYDEFLNAIDEKLNAAREEIQKQNEAVKEWIEDQVTKTISDANKIINETKDELDATKEEMLGRLEEATDALEKASDLFEMEDGNITSDDLKNVFESVGEYNDWMNRFSGSVEEITMDYDKAKKEMGGIGSGADITEGLLSLFAINVNTLCGTVGTIKQEIDAGNGMISSVATWIDESAGTISEAAQYISASGAAITDMVNYVVGGELTSMVESTINAAEGRITDKLMAETEAGINNVTQELNSFSAYISNQITYLAPNSAITAMGERMDAMNGKIDRWMTKSDENLSKIIDLREDWSIESGKLSTVSSMLAETDADGNVMYYTSATTNSAETRVYKDENGKWHDESGNEYTDDLIYVHYGSLISSYIQQTSSSITLSVFDDDTKVTGALKIELGEDGKSYIKTTSDKFIMDSDLIVKAIEAKSANIGGVIIDYGSVYTMANADDGNPIYKLDGVTGEMIATNANIRGTITATAGSIGGLNINGNSIYSTLKSGSEPVFKVDSAGTLTAMNAKISGEIIADSGEIGGFILEDNMLKATNSGGKIVAILNGNDMYSDSENGKIVIAAGVTNLNATTVTAKTMIYSEGMIETANILITEGTFKGDIEAGGTFSGTLDNCNGNLRNVNITNGNFSGNIELGARSTFVFEDVLNIEHDVIGGIENTTSSHSIKEIDFNQKNTGKSVIRAKGTKEMFNRRFSKAGTLTLPIITGTLHIWAPLRRPTNSTGRINIKLRQTGTDEKSHTLINVPPYECTGTSQAAHEFDWSGQVNFGAIEVKSGDTISIIYEYDVPLCARNTSSSHCSATFHAATVENASFKPNEGASGMELRTNGFRCHSGRGGYMAYRDGSLDVRANDGSERMSIGQGFSRITGPNNTCRLVITENSIYIEKDGKQFKLTDLIE